MGAEEFVLEQELEGRSGGFVLGPGFETIVPGLDNVHEKEMDLKALGGGPLLDGGAFFLQQGPVIAQFGQTDADPVIAVGFFGLGHGADAADGL